MSRAPLAYKRKPGMGKGDQEAAVGIEGKEREDMERLVCKVWP